MPGVVHPENPEIHTINQTLFYGPIIDTPGGKRLRNTVVVSPGASIALPVVSAPARGLRYVRARRAAWVAN